MGAASGVAAPPPPKNMDIVVCWGLGGVCAAAWFWCWWCLPPRPNRNGDLMNSETSPEQVCVPTGVVTVGL